MHRFATRIGRAAGAVIAVVGLALTGLVAAPPAQAAVTLAGTVALPAGFRSEPDTGNLVLAVLDAEDPMTRLGQTMLGAASPDFAFSGLPEGRGYLLWLWDNSGQLEGGVLVDVRTGAIGPSLDDAARLTASMSGLTLRPLMSGVVEGVVTGPPGFTGDVRGQIALQSESGVASASANVEPDGSFRIVGLERGVRYRVQFDSYSEVLSGFYTTRRTGLTRFANEATLVMASGAPIRLQGRRSTTMSGALRVPAEAGAHHSRVDVQIVDRTGLTRVDGGSTEVANDGSFEVAGLDPEAAYTVGWEGPGLADQYLGEAGASTWSRTAAAAISPRRGLELTGSAPARISGRVVMPDGVTGAMPSVTVVREDPMTTTGASLDQDGTFTVEKLIPGEPVRLEVTDVYRVLEEGWYAGSDHDLAPRPTEGAVVTAGARDLVLRPTATTISGRVVFSDPQPDTPDVWVTAWSGDDYVKSASVDGEGRFSLPGVRTGSSYVLELESASGSVRTGFLAASGALVQDREDAVLVAAGTAGLRVPAQAAGTVAVSVALPEGRSARDVIVSAHGRDGLAASRARLQAGGSAVLTNLAQGEPYTLSLDAYFSATGWYAEDQPTTVALRSAATPVTAGASVSFAAAPPASVSGVVKRPAAGDAYRDVWVDVIDAGSGELATRAKQFDGVLRGLDTLPAGSYVLGIARRPGPSMYAPSYYAAGTTGVTDRDEATVVTVAPDLPVEDVVVTATTCASLAGTIDRPVGAREVGHVRLWADDPALVERTWTGEPGDDEYQVTGLQRGTYHVGLRVGVEPEVRLDDVTIHDCMTVVGHGLGDDPRVHADTLPQVTGEPTVGETLTLQAATWPSGVQSVEHQWFRGMLPIPGATGTEYALQPADLGLLVSVETTARRAASRPTTVRATTTTPVTRATMPAAAVAVTGDVAVGAPLSATVTGWGAGAELAWQWTRDGWPIDGATTATYTPQRSDAGHLLRAVAIGRVPGAVPGTTTSEPRAVPLPPTLTATAAPIVSPAPRVGVVAHASPGAWSLRPTAVAYQWLRDGSAILRATSATYIPVAADNGHRLAVRVTASASGHPARSSTSGSRLVSPGAIHLVARPTVSGTARVGGVLRAGTGRWSPSGVTLRYRWLRNGVPIPRATGPTYRVGRADVGMSVAVVVTASRPGYTTATATSAPTVLVRRP